MAAVRFWMESTGMVKKMYRQVGFAFLISSSLGLFSSSSAMAQTQTRDGAILGGATGAILGGVIGNSKNKTTTGAIIGGTVGAVAGGVIGNQKEQAARQRQSQTWYPHQPQYYYHGPVHYPVQSQTYYYHGGRYYAYPVHHTYPVTVVEPVVVTSTPITTVGVPIEKTTNSPPSPLSQSLPVKSPTTPLEIIRMTRSGISEAIILNHIQAHGLAIELSVDEIVMLHEAGVSDRVIQAMQSSPTRYPTSDSAPRTATQPTSNR